MQSTVTTAVEPLKGTLTLRQPIAGFREFELIVNHAPFQRDSAGEPVAREMLIWGDIDPNCNEKIQATEATSKWLPYVPNRQLVLSAGPGNKVVNVKLRNDTGTTAVLIGPKDEPVLPLVVGTEPHASLLWSSYKRGTTLTGWSPSVACTSYHFALHKVDRATYPDRIDITNGGALAAGQYIEVAVPPQTRTEYRILIMQILATVNGVQNWWPPSVDS